MIKCYLSELLEKRRITSVQLVEETNLTQATVRKLLDGSAHAIHFDELEAICDFFGCEVGDLLSHQG